MSGWRRWAVAAMAAVVVLGYPSRGVAGATATIAVGHPPAPATRQIRHVIVIIQSHHSFDNYFALYHGVPPLPSGACLPTALPGAGCVEPFTLAPGSSKAGLNDSASAMLLAIDGGRMDGFVRAQSNARIGTVAMGHYGAQDMEYYWSLARRFTLFDNFFAATPGGSFPNRLFAISGQDAGYANAGAAAAGVDVATIFDELQAKGVSWEYYVEGLNANELASPSGYQKTLVPLLSMPRILHDPAMAGRITGLGRYFSDLESGKLPAVSYVAATSSSEQPPQDPSKGEAFVRTLINALMQSSAWSSTAVILTWDEAGGWYDHVAPPMVGVGAAGTTRQLGLRVPALLVSPYSRAGSIVSGQLDTTSILRFIEQNWGLAPLTSRDASASSLSLGLDLARKPIPPLVSSAVPMQVAASHRPAWLVYLFYLGALAAAAGVLILAATAERRGRGNLEEAASEKKAHGWRVLERWR